VGVCLIPWVCRRLLYPTQGAELEGCREGFALGCTIGQAAMPSRVKRRCDLWVVRITHPRPVQRAAVRVELEPGLALVYGSGQARGVGRGAPPPPGVARMRVRSGAGRAVKPHVQGVVGVQRRAAAIGAALHGRCAPPARGCGGAE